MTTQTESTPSTSQNQLAITMYYDDACVLCSTEAHNMQTRNPQAIELIPVNKNLDMLQAAGFNQHSDLL